MNGVVYFLAAMSVLNFGAVAFYCKQRNYPDAWVFLTYGLSYFGFIARALGVK